jgi:HEAT repeat protein
MNLLASADPEERRLAVISLAGDKGAVAPLVEALGDSEWRVRKAAAEVVAGIDIGEVFDGLYSRLFSEDNAGARNSAVEAFVRIGGPAVAALSRKVTEPDPDVRKFIVDILGEIGIPECIPALVHALDDEDTNIRASAVEHLGRLKAVEALDRMVYFMRTEDQWLAFSSAAALGEMGDPRAVKPLIRAAADPYLREAAIDALRLIADDEAWDTLSEALSDKSAIIRETAVKGLARIFEMSGAEDQLAKRLRETVGENAVRLIRGCLGNEDGELSESAAIVLGILRDKASVHQLAVQLLDSGDHDAALWALREISKDGVEPFLFLVTDGQAQVRAAAARTLGLSGDARVVNFLIPMLCDENGHVRGAAAQALGRIGDPSAAAALFELLTDEYEDVQEHAVRALGKLKDADLKPRMAELAGDEDPTLRRNIAALAGMLPDRGCAGILMALLKDEDPEVRMAAVASIAVSGEERSCRYLINAVTDEDSSVRLAAVNALTSVCSAEAFEPLLLLLADEDPWVRAAAAKGVVATGDPRALGSVAPLLKDPYGPVRIAVIEAIGAAGLPAAARYIRAAFKDADPEVRKSAAASCAYFRDEDFSRELEGLLADGDWSVRNAAVEAIGALAYDGSMEAIKRAASDDEELVRLTAGKFLGK